MFVFLLLMIISYTTESARRVHYFRFNLRAKNGKINCIVGIRDIRAD